MGVVPSKPCKQLHEYCTNTRTVGFPFLSFPRKALSSTTDYSPPPDAVFRYPAESLSIKAYYLKETPASVDRTKILC
jgi:hypothetical protein